MLHNIIQFINLRLRVIEEKVAIAGAGYPELIRAAYPNLQIRLQLLVEFVPWTSG